MEGVNYPYLFTFLTAMLGIWKAVPVGFAFGVNPYATYILTVVGSVSAVIILYFFGNRIRQFIQSKKPGLVKNKKKARAMQLFEKYGAPGLGLVGCLLLGPNLTILTGVVIVHSPRKLLCWTIAGILIWSLVLTLIAVFSVDLFHQLTGK